MITTEQLTSVLKPLRLSGILDTLELRIEQAVDEKLPHQDFLHRLLSDEVHRRDGRKLDLRLKQAAFEGDKTLEGFDFAFNPDLPREKLIDLGSCAFVGKRENVLLVGPTGVGKSHIAQALGHKACRLGHRVLYTQANGLLRRVKSSRGDGTYDKHLAKLAKLDLLIVDDLGLAPLTPEQATDLYELIRLRYEVASTVMTSNRAVTEWYPLFKDDLLASAAMDRILHHAHVVTMNGDSYRNPPNKRSRRKAQKN